MFAVLSDIHANREAFTAVLKRLQELKPDRIFCLGDIVGYGPDPEWCVDMALKKCEIVLCGNHDFALIYGATSFSDVADAAIKYHRHLLMPPDVKSDDQRGRLDRWNALKQLSHRYSEDGHLFVHASPRDPINEYLREREAKWGPSRKLAENFALVEWLAFVGHTHRPGVITQAPEFVKPEEMDNLYRAMPGRKAIVNVGSVGQSRDGNPRAVFVTVDGTEIRYHRVQYDVEKTIEKIEADGVLDYRLAERLREGA